jgi:uncharacterized protein YkwD
MLKFPKPATAGLAAALLVACGGGGSDTKSVAASSSAAAGALGTTPYAPGSPQRLALDTLNAARDACGFGTVSPSLRLDQAAANHASYLALNNVVGHFEELGRTGYTGVEPADRAATLGYRPNRVNENIAFGSFGGGEDAARAVRTLLAAPYHAHGMLSAYTDVGIAVATAQSGDAVVIDLGNPFADPLPAPASVLTYPCAGVTNAMGFSNHEAPTPFPSLPDASWGQPILVRGPESLRISNVTISGLGQEVPVLVTYGDGATPDPQGFFMSGWFAIIPAVLRGPDYAVTIDYTIGGATGSTRFAFSTTP